MNATTAKILKESCNLSAGFQEHLFSIAENAKKNFKSINTESFFEIVKHIYECHLEESANDSDAYGELENKLADAERKLEEYEEMGDFDDFWKVGEFNKLPFVLADFVEDRKAYEFARLNVKAQRRICDFIARELDGQPLEVAEVAAPAAKADELDGVDVAAIMAHFENVTERPAVEKKEDRAEFGKAYQGADCCKLFEVGDVVEVSGSYSKSENGYYYVSGGNDSSTHIWLYGLSKDFQKETKKYTNWPLSTYSSNYEYRAEYRKFAKTATITRIDKKSAAVKDYLEKELKNLEKQDLLTEFGEGYKNKLKEILERDYADFVDTVKRIPARDGIDWIKFDKNGIWTPSEDRKSWEFNGCWYSPTVKNGTVESITIRANDYCKHIPLGYGFGVQNDSDVMTDYFETDRANVTPDHPLFKFVAAAAVKAGNLKDMKTDNLPKGNPTEKDIEALEKWIEEKRAAAEAEKQRKEAEEQESRYMAYLEVEATTAATIANARAIYPEECSAYKVTITKSERPGICSDGEPLTVSLPAAQMIFAELDDWQHANRGEGKFYGWYNKTWWKMAGPDIPGGEMSDRFDIGDYGDGRGLLGDIAPRFSHSEDGKAFILRLVAECQRAAERAGDRL